MTRHALPLLVALLMPARLVAAPEATVEIHLPPGALPGALSLLRVESGKPGGGIPAPFDFGLDTYVVRKGDSLSRIARALWGDARLWPLLFGANRDQIRNPHLIYPGQVLRVPRMGPQDLVAWAPPTGVPQPPPPIPGGGKGTGGGTVSTRSPQFPAWFAEASNLARRTWRFPAVTNKYGQLITHEDFIKAILYIESRGNHTDASGRIVGSSAGAQGWMQLMPGTALEMGVNPLDPRQNLLGGVGYLASVFNAPATRGASGDTPADILVKAAAGYNKGPYSRDLTHQSWSEFVRTSRVSETVRYGITLKMALGLSLTPTEEVWYARDQGLSLPSVASVETTTFQRVHSIA